MDNKKVIFKPFKKNKKVIFKPCMDNNIWWFVIPIILRSKAMYRTFTNLEWVEDDHGNGGEDDNNIVEEVDHETWDTNEHED